MNVRRLSLTVLAGALLAGVPSTASFGQKQPDGEPRRQGGQGGQGNFNAEEFRARMDQRMKEQLGANDEEWKVLQPKVEKVTRAQREARGMGGFRSGRGRGPGGGAATGPDQEPSAVSKASSELRTTLENKDASADELNAKLNALRDARAKAKAELDGAQKELKEVLTARQEAVFVSMGMLE